MPFKPGTSGNPGGRPVKEGYRVHMIREELAKDLPKIVAILRDKALEGDMVAIRLIIERTTPACKPIDQNLAFRFEGETLVEKSEAIMNSAAKAEIPLSQACLAVSALVNVAKIKAESEILDRLTELEQGLSLLKSRTASFNLKKPISIKKRIEAVKRELANIDGIDTIDQLLIAMTRRSQSSHLRNKPINITPALSEKLQKLIVPSIIDTLARKNK